MTSDRTLTRSGLSDQQGAWNEPAPASRKNGPGRKMPSAQRERKPALFALAVLLVALGAGAAGLLVLRAGGTKVQAIQITEQVSQGAQFPAAAMQEVDLPATSALVQGQDYVPWSDEALYTKFFAAATVMPGTLLTNKMATAANTTTAGQNLVGLSLKSGQVPAGLTAGDKVGAVSTSNVCGTTPGQVLASPANVTSVSGDVAAGTAEMVTIATQPGQTATLSCDAANGDVALVQLPSAGGTVGSGTAANG
jgi:hypothetical protein